MRTASSYQHAGGVHWHWTAPLALVNQPGAVQAQSLEALTVLAKLNRLTSGDPLHPCQGIIVFNHDLEDDPDQTVWLNFVTHTEPVSD